MAALLEQTRIRPFTSSGLSGSGGSLRPLLAGAWSIMAADLKNYAFAWKRPSIATLLADRAEVKRERNCFEKMSSGCLHAFRAGDGLKARGAISIFDARPVALALRRSRPASRAEAIVSPPMLDSVSPLSVDCPYRIGLAHGRFASPPISRNTLDLLTPCAKAGRRNLPATLEALPVVMPANRPCGVDTD